MATAVGAQTRARTAILAGADYIVGPLYDWCLFLLPPVFALGLGIALADSPLSKDSFDLAGESYTWTSLMIGVFIHAHLVIVFVRSHGNRDIFALHPYRFIAVPLLLFTGMVLSTWVIVAVSVLVTFWDVYHSALQTFGFGRIYDRKRGNDPLVGRRLDWWINQLLYAGPIVGGATMLDHFEDFENFDEVGASFFTAIPAYMTDYHAWLTWGVLGLGTLFVAYYVFANWRLHAQGYRVSPLKVFLLASTGLVSIYTWGFNSFGMAFFIMNFFHALQYFGIVWAFEKKTLMNRLGVGPTRVGRALALGFLILPAFAYGFWVETVDTDITWMWAITLVVSVMHFWYDGFIWSVRKKQV